MCTLGNKPDLLVALSESKDSGSSEEESSTFEVETEVMGDYTTVMNFDTEGEHQIIN